MRYRYRIWSCAAVCLLMTSPLAAQSGPVIVPKVKQPVRFPTQAEVDKVLADYLAQIPDRQEDDLISRGDIAPLFQILEKFGWEVVDESEISKRLLPDSDWLVRTLRTPKGMIFMRGMSSYPGGYDRLDRMQNETYGKREMKGLIDTPGGAELIEYLTTTKQGRRTGSQLKGKHGGIFNKPTGRLYTKADVLKQFRTSYAEEAARRLKAMSTPVVAPTINNSNR